MRNSIFGDKTPRRRSTSLLKSNKYGKNNPTCDYPKISIVTPSFNQGRFIQETLDSVISQNYPNTEFIVMDGGSTDQTVSILEQYSSRLSYWISEPDKGQSDALNKGFSRSTGDILGWLNSDDQLAPGALHALAENFRVSGADIVAGVVNVNRDGKLVHKHRTGLKAGILPLELLLDLKQEWLEGRFFFQPEVYFTRRVFDAIGGRVDSSLYYSMDYDLWVRLGEQGCTILPIDWEIANFRIHSDQKTSSVQAYLPELSMHNGLLRQKHGLPEQPLPQPDATPRRSARVGLINDFGFEYGAGRAHRRIAEVLARGGMDVSAFAFSGSLGEPIVTDMKSAALIMREAKPDVIIVGNLHGVFPQGADLLALSEIAPLLIITHDFFWFTGRCPYPMGCREYLHLCPAECPTREQYPVIPYSAIPRAHLGKMEVWDAPNVYFGANSDYVKNWTVDFLNNRKIDRAYERVKRIALGVPEQAFFPQDSQLCRSIYGLTSTDFVVLVSSTSVDDPRKRFNYVEKACEISGVRNLVILAMGYVPPDQELPGVKYTGYLQDDAEISACFSAADVFIGASADETFGQTFAEAAMCGCPSIAFDVGALGETIVEDESGWLVTDENVEAMAKKIAELASDPKMRALARDRAYIYARSRLGAPTMLQALQDALRTIIQDPAVRIPAGVQFDGDNSKPIQHLDARLWRIHDGFSEPEGPYPEGGIERRFWWLENEVGFLEIYVEHGGPNRLRIDCETLAEDQIICFEVEGLKYDEIEIQPSNWCHLKQIELNVDMPAGWTRVKIEAQKYFETPDKRQVYVAIFSATCTSTAPGQNGTGELKRTVSTNGFGELIDCEALAEPRAIVPA